MRYSLSGRVIRVPFSGNLTLQVWHRGNGEQVKKADIDAMMEHFNIDAANPVVCLTQANPAHNHMKHDMARVKRRRSRRKGPLAGCHVICNAIV